MSEILSTNPVLLLFVVASLGYLIGSIKIGGSSLGVAAVLFTGLAIGAINPAFRIPDIVFILGLSIYVYSIGLRSGPAFFRSYQKNGLRDFLFIIGMLCLTGLIATGLFFLWDFSAATVTGMYAGSSTNTAAMAGVIEYIGNSYPEAEATAVTSDVALGYTYSYPMGVMGAMIAIVLMERLFKIDYAKESKTLQSEYPLGEDLTSQSIEITSTTAIGKSLREVSSGLGFQLNFGRVMRDGKVSLAHWEWVFQAGDQLMIVGSKSEIGEAINQLGRAVDSGLSYDRRHYDVRRIFVSNSRLAGRTLASLNLAAKFDAVITRIRRGDVDMLAQGNTVLELGDRIRFIASRKDLKKLSRYFGDSYQRSSQVNLFSFGLGIGLGLLLGSIELTLSPTITLKLGYAGGPLIVGLLLGTLRRTGPIVWTLPYGANVTLEQIGLIFLLSAIGVKSGNGFFESLSAEGLTIFLGGSIISLLTAFITLLVGYKLLRIPFSFLMGMVSNQPAILDFAKSRTGNRIPDYGFSMVFPIALIMKIVIAQLLFVVLQT